MNAKPWWVTDVNGEGDAGEILQDEKAKMRVDRM